MPVLNDTDLSRLTTPWNAEQLARRLLPDLTPDDAGNAVRMTEQHLLTYALVDAAQSDIREVDRVQVFLAQDVHSLTDRFKGPQSPALENAAAFLLLIYPPQLMQAQWSVMRAIGREHSR